ncbi:MAG: ABC transporter permease [Desulfobacteraceae bacterium]|nr:ABC transporter permease [Desulfobacteraceae bacterium]
MRQSVLKRFMKRKIAVLGAVIIVLFVFMALVGPYLCAYDPLDIDVLNKYQSSSREHLLGTDNLGRDTLTRLVYGARITFIISVTSVFIGSLIGMIFGVIAGYFGGKTDAVIMRATDVLLAFPGLLLAIAIVAILGTGIINTIIAIAIFSIPYLARIVRGSVLTIRNSEYIHAAKVIGASHLRTIIFHIVPNSLSQVIVNTTLNLGTAILTSSALSFLGLGVQPPDPEWGAMLSKAREVMRSTPIAALAPGIAITLVVMGFSLMGDGLRDALDPRSRND